MSKDLLVLADEYAAATATFARALALKDEADSMSPIAREAGDKRAVLAEALAALDTARPVQVNAMLVEDVNSEIVKRYKVEKTKGGFWPYCVKAGDGTMDLFIGSKKQAHHVRQALQSACLDGAFMALTAAKQAQPERAPLSDAEIEDLRGEANRGYCIDKGAYFKAFRDAEQAHGIKQGGQQ